MNIVTLRCRRLVKALGLSLILPMAAAQADTVIMKPSATDPQGKQYKDAKVLSETNDSVTFEYIVVGKIKDTKTVLKTEVAQIIRQKPEEVEIVPLREMAKLPDLSTADKYEMVMKDNLLPFINKYPGTPQAAEAEGLMKTLQEEKEKVVSGSIKMDGKWLTPEQAKRDAVEIDAYKVRRQIGDLAAKGQYRDALNEWMKMKDREEGFSDTLQYVETIPQIKDILVKYKAQLDGLLAQQPGLVAARTKNLAALVEPDLSRAQRAYAKEDADFKAKADMERQLRVQWTSTYKYDLKSIQDALKDISTETAALTVIDLDKVKTQNEHIAAARRYIADGNLEQAEMSVTKAQAIQMKDSSRSLQRIRNELGVLRSEANKKKNNQRLFGATAGKGPSASTFGAKTTVDDRVAAATAAADSKATQMAEGKEPATDGKAGTGTGLTSLDNPGKKPAATTASDDDKPAAKPRKKTAVDEEEGGMQSYMLYGGIGLLAVLLVAMFMQKRKK